MSTDKLNIKKGPVAWMASHHVAANLLMLIMIFGGLYRAFNIKQEVFPSFEVDQVAVTVIYPGSGPEDVELGVLQVIEEAVSGLEGVKEVTSTAREGSGVVMVALMEGEDLDQLATDVRNEIDRIRTFPIDAEDPTIRILKMPTRGVNMVLSGDCSETTLRNLSEDFRAELLAHKNIISVDLANIRPREIAIEVSPETLKTYNLTLEGIAKKIRSSSLDLPAGGVKTTSGEVLIRITERRDYAEEFASLEIGRSTGGTPLLLRDIAMIHDGFEDKDIFATWNNMPCIDIVVNMLGSQTPIEVSDATKEVLAKYESKLPNGVSIEIFSDNSDSFRERIDLLLRNAGLGLILVLIILSLFLEFRLAFWVMMGIPTSFLGALIFLPALDVSINMVTLFAFIISLGIVVDDAIVVGENIFDHRSKGHGGLMSAILGVKEVAMPVFFSILTNIVAFMPLAYVTGVMGKIFQMIPMVVVLVFIASMVEVLFVLPSHVGQATKKGSSKESLFALILKKFIDKFYGPFLKWSLRFRYVMVAAGVSVLVVTVAYLASGRMGLTMFPKVESDFAIMTATLPFGAPVEETKSVRDRIIRSASEIADEYTEPPLVKGIYSSIGGASNRSSQSGGHIVSVKVLLEKSGLRPISTSDFTDRWLEIVGDVPGTESIVAESDSGGPGGGAAIDVQLLHKNILVLEKTAQKLADSLSDFSDIRSIDNGISKGKPQFEVTLLPEGIALGLNATAVARQLRASFYGAEAIRQQRGRDELKIQVRYPKSDRVSKHDIESFLVSTPLGVYVPLRDVAHLKLGNSYTEIKRIDGRRTIKVTADVEPRSRTILVKEKLQTELVPNLLENTPGLSISYGGKQKEFAESLSSLKTGFLIAIFVIYALLAIPFNSYFQPLIIMISIPFGIVGAVLGHLIMGYDLSLISMFGIVALSGVVVNDSLVLVEFANSRGKEGLSVQESVWLAGMRRFRPIMLTSVTTFVGLAPMIFETSRQARFLIPMAISLGFGLIFATVIALVLVPCLYVIHGDFESGLRKLKNLVFG